MLDVVIRTIHRRGFVVTQKKLRACPKFSRVAWQHDPHEPIVRLARLGCGQWSCDYCAAKMQAKWRAHLGRKMPKIADNWHLVTLTSPAHERTVEGGYRALRRGIDLLFKRARNIWTDINYVRVFEVHKKGGLHAHLIVSNLTPYVVREKSKNGKFVFKALVSRKSYKGSWGLRTWVKKTAQQCGMGYIADVRKIPSGVAILYVTKYLTKSQQNINIKGLRHVQTTRDIGGIRTQSDGTWYSGYRITVRDITAKERLYDLQKRNFVDSTPRAIGDVYPALNEPPIEADD